MAFLVKSDKSYHLKRALVAFVSSTPILSQREKKSAYEYCRLAFFVRVRVLRREPHGSTANDTVPSKSEMTDLRPVLAKKHLPWVVLYQVCKRRERRLQIEGQAYEDCGIYHGSVRFVLAGRFGSQDGDHMFDVRLIQKTGSGRFTPVITDNPLPWVTTFRVRLSLLNEDLIDTSVVGGLG